MRLSGQPRTDHARRCVFMPWTWWFFPKVGEALVGQQRRKMSCAGFVNAQASIANPGNPASSMGIEPGGRQGGCSWQVGMCCKGAVDRLVCLPQFFEEPFSVWYIGALARMQAMGDQRVAGDVTPGAAAYAIGEHQADALGMAPALLYGKAQGVFRDTVFGADDLCPCQLPAVVRISAA